MIKCPKATDVLISGLSFKSRNLLSTFDSLEDASHFIKSKGSFTVIPGIGRRTDYELRNFLNEYEINKMVTDSDVDHLFDETAEILFRFYENLKYHSSRRTHNILNALEQNYFNVFSSDHKALFLRRIFIEPYDFINLRNAGKKTVQELEIIRDAIIKENSIVRLGNVQVNQVDPEMENSIKIYKLLKESLSMDRIKLTVQNPLVAAFEFLGILLYISTDKERKKHVLLEYFFSLPLKNHSDIALDLDYSRERVRQIILSSSAFLTNKYWPALKRVLPPIDLDAFSIIYSRNVSINHEIKLELSGRILRPNAHFIDLATSVLFKSTHLDLFSKFRTTNYSVKSFVITEKTIWISKKFEGEYRLVEMFKWIDQEIYSFKKSDFDYDLNVLVIRYFKEHGLSQNSDLISNCVRIVQSILREEWPDMIVHQRIANRKKHIDNICDICKSKLISSGSYLKTKEFIQELLSQSIEISTPHLLTILNEHSEFFRRVGNGKWQLTESSENHSLNGSIRDFVYRKLSDSQDPIHLSFFLKELSKARPITEHSFLSNLRADSGKFLFLNCGFIALKGRRYDTKWNNLPKFNGRHMSVDSLKRALNHSQGDIVEYFERKYGYPKVHTEYLLESQNKG